MQMTVIDHVACEKAPAPARRSVADLLGPLDRIAAASSSLVANYGAQFKSGGKDYALPRYLFIGPRGAMSQSASGCSPGFTGMSRKGCMR